MMEKAFNNESISKDLNDILSLNKNDITKGNISGYSIELPIGKAQQSYVYYDDENARDADFTRLQYLIDLCDASKTMVSNVHEATYRKFIIPCDNLDAALVHKIIEKFNRDNNL